MRKSRETVQLPAREFRWVTKLLPDIVRLCSPPNLLFLVVWTLDYRHKHSIGRSRSWLCFYNWSTIFSIYFNAMTSYLYILLKVSLSTFVCCCIRDFPRPIKCYTCMRLRRETFPSTFNEREEGGWWEVFLNIC